MKTLLALAIAPLIVTNSFHIPENYGKDRTTMVHFTNQKGIDKKCGAASDPRLYTMACAFADTNELYLPNPCRDKDVADPESYAHLACHELAHLNGWHHINE